MIKHFIIGVPSEAGELMFDAISNGIPGYIQAANGYDSILDMNATTIEIYQPNSLGNYIITCIFALPNIKKYLFDCIFIFSGSVYKPFVCVFQTEKRRYKRFIKC